MLEQLTIQNYAIIDFIDIRFPGGMNVVTGETGAGKSIIMGALGLILGDRADSSVLVNKDKKCIVEGTFKTGNRSPVRSFLKEYELDNNDDLVLRREITTSGKSRAFVNDTPVNLDQLRKLSGLLVDLHQQFDALQLGEDDFQREVTDALAGNNDILREYQAVYYQWRVLQKELEALRARKLQFDKEADYNKFQFFELEEAAFTENELEEIDAELRMLNNAEDTRNALSKIYFELKESENPIIQQLKVLGNQLQPYADLHPQLPALVQRLQSVQLELQDIAGDLGNASHYIKNDPERIEQLNERLALGYKLLKKHGAKTTTELLEIQKRFGDRLHAISDIDDEIKGKERDVTQAKDILWVSANKISDARHKQLKPLEKAVNELLARVGMPNARLRIDIRDESELNAFGINSIDFLFDANKSKQYLPIRKVASGGELSRLMLCIKSLVAQKLDMPILIFDEIDAGISGEAARQVAAIMKELAENRQLICITHQPQIAGKAGAHFLVYKNIVGNEVKTNIRLLDSDERITAIAKMLSGEKPTAAAMANAKEMVNN